AASLFFLQVLLELLPERFLRRRLAVVDQGADGLPELVEGDHADGGFALRDLVAVDPVGDALLVVRVHGEKLFARDLIHLLLFRFRSHLSSSHEGGDHEARGGRADDPMLAHVSLLLMRVPLLTKEGLTSSFFRARGTRRGSSCRRRTSCWPPIAY